MRIIDRIALNRLLNIITSFILEIIKIFANHADTDKNIIDNKRRKIFPLFRKSNTKESTHD